MRKQLCILLALLPVCISIGPSAAATVMEQRIPVSTTLAIAYDDQNCDISLSGGTIFLTGDTTCVIRPGKADSDEDEKLEELENGFEKSLYYDEIKSYDFSDYERELMAEVVLAEAGTEPFEGKVAVAAVILSRYFGWYADSIEGIIYSPNQFAPPDRSLYTDPRQEEIIEAVEMACKGVDPTYGCFHFVADYCEWQPEHVVITIGHHNFY